MRGEMQGTDECILATIADVANRPLVDVRAMALALAPGYSAWADVVRDSQSKKLGSIFWEPVRVLSNTLDASGRLWEAIATASYSRRPNFPSSIFFTARKKYLPVRGRGVIVSLNTRARAAHIAPWHDGMVYDSSSNLAGKALTLEQYKQYLRAAGYRINRISVIE